MAVSTIDFLSTGSVMPVNDVDIDETNLKNLSITIIFELYNSRFENTPFFYSASPTGFARKVRF